MPSGASTDPPWLGALAEALARGQLFGPGSDAARAASRATYATSQCVTALAVPADVAEVQACVAVARAHGLALHPVSRGRNWGYGSRVPLADGAVVLSLERLDAIHDFDADLGLVRIGPGVSFAALARFVADQGADLVVNPPGSTAQASVIGHALERGVVQGRDPERAAQLSDLEAVLGTGEAVRLGGAGLGGLPVLGPDATELVTQGRGAIVTAATIRLPRRPAHHAAFTFEIPAEADLPKAVDAIRALRESGSVAVPIALFNRYRVASMLGRYPFDAVPDGRVLEPDELGARLGLHAAWYGQGAVSGGTRAVFDAHRDHVADALGDCAAEVVFDPAPDRDPFHRPEPLTDVGSIWWRMRSGAPSADPDAGGVGALWASPAVPLKGAEVARAMTLAQEVFRAHQLEPMLSLQAVSARVGYVLAAVLFDPAQADEAARAQRCYEALLTRCAAAGFPPYRVAQGDLSLCPPAAPGVGPLQDRQVAALDPDGVIAPGRYRPRGGG